MISGIEASSKYGGLTLTCDEAAFARLCNTIREAADVADVTCEPAAKPIVNFIRVVRVSTESESASRRPAWISVIMTVIGTCLSGVVYVAGLVAIIDWLI
jgi:hypothetical protein